MPVRGPGTYFVTILLVFTAIYPALWLAFARRPLAVLLGAVAADVAFELAAGRVAAWRSVPYPYAYDASILRYAAAIVVGMWLAADGARAAVRRGVIVALAPLSFAYLVVVQADPGAVDFLIPGFGVATNVAAVAWSALLMLAGLRLWPARGIRGTGWLEALGRASYHVFLVQIVWFALVPARSPWRLPLDVVVCGLLGWALYRVLPTARPARLPRRRRGAVMVR
jgi:peptidoglycan/LPS O-acetylase OafA/YrhL